MANREHTREAVDAEVAARKCREARALVLSFPWDQSPQSVMYWTGVARQLARAAVHFKRIRNKSYRWRP